MTKDCVKMGNVRSSDSFTFFAFIRGGLWAELGWAWGSTDCSYGTNAHGPVYELFSEVDL